MADTGWVDPGSGANLARSGSSEPWQNASYVTADDSAYAQTPTPVTELNAANDYTDYLRAYNFGLSSSIPSGATIDGIEARWERRIFRTYNTTWTVDLDNSGSNTGRIYLIDETGATAGNHKGISTDWTTSWVVESIGGATDLWGWSATRTKVVDADFGFALSVRCAATGLGSGYAGVDYMQIRVYYTTAVNGSAALSADASVSAVAKVRKFAQSFLGASSSVSVQAIARLFAQSTLTSYATLESQGVAGLFAQSSLAGDASLTAQGIVRLFAQPSLTAEATLSATGIAKVFARSSLNASADLSTSVIVRLFGEASSVADSALNATAAVWVPAQSSLTAQAVTSAVAVVRTFPQSNLSANASLEANGIAKTFAQCFLDADSSLAATGIGKFVWASSSLLGDAILSGDAFATPQFGEALLEAASDISADALVLAFGNVALGAKAALSASAFATPQFGIASLEAFASLIVHRDVFRWALDDSIVGEDTDVRKLFVQLARDGLPLSPSAGEFYERRLLAIPSIESTQTNPFWGLSGFRQTTVTVDNADGLLNDVDVRGMYARITVERASGLIEEFRGIAIGKRLSWQTEITIEDLDSRIFEETIPKRIVDATTFPNAGEGLGRRIPVVFGRARKVPLTPINLNDASREYDFLICEGNINAVYAVYREDAALDTVTGNVAGASSTTLTLEAGDRRPLDNWYKWFWVEITSGTGSGQIRYVTAYNASSNQITIDSPWSTTPNTSSTYRLREWRLYDGSQSSPYPGLAFIRFKKRLGERTRFDAIYADVRGRVAEENAVRAIESLISNSTWGLGLSVDSTSFNSAASLSEITALKCEGAIIEETKVFDVLDELLSFRGMSLYRSGNGNIGIIVDQPKLPVATFGVGDGVYENIIDFGGIEDTSLLDLTKNITFFYEPSYKEAGELKKAITRSVGALGNDVDIALPFVFSPTTADRIADYRRKKIRASSRTMRITVGLDGENIVKGDVINVVIPSLGISGIYEVIGTRRELTNYALMLMEYDSSTYTYEPSSGLPSDPGNIPTDYSLTYPDPVSGLTVTMGYSNNNSYADLSWTLPDENAIGAVVRYGLSGTSPTLFETAGQGTTSLRVNGLTPGVQYDFAVMSVSSFGLEGYPAMATNRLAAGDTTPPAQVTGLSASADRVGNIQYKWNDLKSSDPTVRHYELQIANNSSFSSGLETKIVDVNEFLYKAKLTDFSTSVTKYARCRAIDFTGNTGSWSSTVSATTGAIQQGDVVNDEITGKGFYQSDSDVSLVGAGEYTLATVSITTRGQPVYVWASWVCRLDSAPGSVAITWRIKRDGATLVETYDSPQEPGTRRSLTYSIVDQPSAGSHTYTVTALGSASATSRAGQTRRLQVSELRR